MQQVTRALSTFVCAVAIAAVCGCADRSNELEILCGGSFRPPMEKLAAMYTEETGQKVVLVFGGSEDHLPKVQERSMGDIFVSHDPYMDKTEKAGAMLRYVPVGHVAPVLVVAKGNPKNLKGFDDLAQKDLRVVLTHPEFSDCGMMVFALLETDEKKYLKEAILANCGNAQVRTHDQVATQIKLGHRDAGIMWNGVANNWLDAVEIIPGPYEYDREIRVAVMGLSYSKRKGQVEQFLQFIEKHGEEAFKEFDYVKYKTDDL